MLKKFLDRVRLPIRKLRAFYWRVFPKYGIRAPILIFQMGKVGSSSIKESLRARLGSSVPLYQVHALMDLDAMEQKARRSDGYTPDPPDEIAWYRHVERFVKASGNKKFLLVSMVRDPVARNISAYFQDLHKFLPDALERHARSQLRIADLCADFFQRMDHAYCLEWFDRQMLPFSQIDVYAAPFPKHVGYQIYTRGNFKLLVLRVQDLDAQIAAAMQEFFNIPNFKLVSTNRSAAKPYAALYREFLAEIIVPSAYLDAMYHSKFARHFFSSQELSAWRTFWGGDTRAREI